MNQDARKRKKGRRIFLPLPNYYLVLSSLTFDFLFSVSPLPTFISSAPVHLFFQTAKALQIRQYMILHIIHISNRFQVNACKVKITGQKKISDILFTISPITFITVFVTSTNQVRYNTETSYLLKSLQRLVQAEAMQ